MHYGALRKILLCVLKEVREVSCAAAFTTTSLSLDGIPVWGCSSQSQDCGTAALLGHVWPVLSVEMWGPRSCGASTHEPGTHVHEARWRDTAAYNKNVVTGYLQLHFMNEITLPSQIKGGSDMPGSHCSHRNRREQAECAH